MTLGKMTSYDRDFGLGFGCTWAFQKEDGVWDIAYDPTVCRSYLICYWYHVTKNSKYYLGYTKNRNIQPLVSDNTQIFWYSGDKTEVYKETVKNNLPKLNKIEERIGIELTKAEWLEDPSGDIGVVFIGDKCWQSTAWKISIYSYYLKYLFYKNWLTNGEYSHYLKDYFLKKVKDFNEEIFLGNDYDSIHRKTGFVSIDEEDNPKMKKLLQGEE